jgi:UDP-galactopyranose mutase
MKSAPIIVAGAGLTGASIARDLADAGFRVRVLEKTSEVGGNCKEGRVLGRQLHLHGPHLFHTNDKSIWEYVQRFGEWRPYEHRVVAEVEGKLVPIPFNLKTFQELANTSGLDEADLIDFCGESGKTTVLRLLNAAQPKMNALGKFVFAMFFEGYSKKQWGKHFETLDDSVLSRVPIRASFDDRYFDDTYQALPVGGYSNLIATMLSHPKIEVEINRPFAKADLEKFSGSTVVYTGAVDDLVAHDEERLPYRSLTFDYALKAQSEHGLTHMQTNFPNQHLFTRITNYSHIFGSEEGVDLLAYEYPSEQFGVIGEKYYPIPTKSNTEKHQLLISRLLRAFPNVWVAGRLGDYKYYNMDQAIARARKLARDIIERQGKNS